MNTLVLKFGGTSVASIDRIQAVADIIATSAKENRVVVVLSAMGGETDKLLALAQGITPKPHPRELDMLLSTGEQVSMSLLAMALHERGIHARSLMAEQVPIITDVVHGKARIEHIDPTYLQQLLNQHEVPIIAGFQGSTQCGQRTTLGRGGSDTTAVAIAAALKADECHIYTDVKGVYTTDPRMVPEARLLRHITFEEILEMSSLGAKILQIRSVEFAGRYKVPLRVRSTFEPEDPGTLITLEEKQMEYPTVSGIAFSKNEAKLTLLGIPDKPGIAGEILGAVSQANIEVDMIVQSAAVEGKTDFTFTVSRQDFDETLAILKKKAYDVGAREVQGNNKVAKISLVGVGMRSHAGIASTMFKTLGLENINILMVTTSEIKVSVGLDEKYLELGVRALHAAFELDSPPKDEGISLQSAAS